MSFIAFPSSTPTDSLILSPGTAAGGASFSTAVFTGRSAANFYRNSANISYASGTGIFQLNPGVYKVTLSGSLTFAAVRAFAMYCNSNMGVNGGVNGVGGQPYSFTPPAAGTYPVSYVWIATCSSFVSGNGIFFSTVGNAADSITPLQISIDFFTNL